MNIRVQVNESVVPKLQELLKRSGDLSPAMQRIQREVFDPLAAQAMARSGLRSRSGALFGAVTPFSGRVSAGVGLRAQGGRRDKGLVFAKASTHTFGRKKFSNKRRVNKKTGVYFRRSPWGDIPARPFIPGVVDVNTRMDMITSIVEEYLHVATL